MATRTIVRLTDDTDGKPATETVRFGLDGRNFEIDLSERNATALRKDIEPWLAAARRIPGTRANSPTRVETGVDGAAVRAWAASNGIELSTRGRLPGHVIDKYRAAGNQPPDQSTNQSPGAGESAGQRRPRLLRIEWWSESGHNTGGANRSPRAGQRVLVRDCIGEVNAVDVGVFDAAPMIDDVDADGDSPPGLRRVSPLVVPGPSAGRR